MTILSKLLNFIAELIGTTSMGTTADTITGAIAEINAKTTGVQTATWSDIHAQGGVTNVLADFSVTPGRYIVIAKNGNGLADGTRCTLTIRVSSGTVGTNFGGDDSGYSGQNNWGNAWSYCEMSTNGVIRVSSYGKVGTDPVLRGDAVCIRLM